MAIAPQNKTRIEPVRILAPPAHAAIAPSNAKNASEHTAMIGIISGP